MTAKPMTPEPIPALNRLAAASPDLLRELLSTFIDALMSARSQHGLWCSLRGGQSGP